MSHEDFDQSLARQSAGGGNALALAETARATQEVQAALIIAQRFPRDEVKAIDRIKNACARPNLAAQAIYTYSRGGSAVEGPSIRLAEAIAQQWGNIEWGFREISRGADPNGVTFSEVQAFAWDMQTNTRRPVTFVVRHWRDRRNNQGYAITDERDIYELVANQAARRVRACILSVIPGDVTEFAVDQCNATLAADADTSPDAQAKIVAQFAKWDVTKEQIEARIQRRLDAILPAQVIALRKIAASIRDGVSRPEEWFEAAKPAPLETPLDPRKKTAAAAGEEDQKGGEA